ncbi:MAG: peptidoglycan-binding protein [Clostridiales bacterium]|nr:peptidoglycan-binding protein [Clostridiales bacterium]
MLAALFEQIKKGSIRAIAVATMVVLLVVSMPLTLILTNGAKDRPGATPAQAAGTAENMLVLDIGRQTYSAGAQNVQEQNAAPTPTPEPHPDNGEFLKRGMTAGVVAEVQERLMELGYMDWDEPTTFFGPNTKDAVMLFQRQHGLDMDGSVGTQTYSVLMSADAQKYTITIGVEDDDVLELQKRLRELGYLNKATRYFGTETEAAVKTFQEKNGLSPDGKVGEKTREMLYSEDAKANYFGRGEVSEKLREYQNRLKSLGYLTTDADGKYGNDTENAVRRFQERSGLIADGYLGPDTIKFLMAKEAQANALMIGMKGSDITKIQERLQELNYLSGKADGYFGSGTETAVRNFQNQNGLSVDGKVGKKTLNLLMSSGAKKSDGSSAGSSSSSNASANGSSGSGDSGGSGMVQAPGANVETFIAVAESKIGSKYVRGGKGPSVFDCSGFVYWCLNQAGVSQGYMTSGGWQKTTKYQRISSMNGLERGDVVSFKGHVGIYLGGGRMIDASSSQGKVRVCSAIQESAYWKKTFVCGFRIF